MKPRSRGYWTDERLLIEIRKLKDSGISLKESNVRKINGSLTHLAAKRYGGWYNAVKEAGIDPTPYMVEKPKGYWTKEKIIEEIIELHDSGHSLKYSEAKSYAPDLVSAALDKFKGWFKAVEAAGFLTTDHSNYEKWTPDLVVARILELKNNGEDLSAGHIYSAHSKLMNAAVRKFGKWEIAVEAAGINYDLIRKQHKEYTKQDILDKFSDLQKQGIPLNMTSVQSYDASIVNAARNKFGSYKAAITAFGLDYNKVNLDRLANRIEWSREKVIEELKEYYRKNGSFDLLNKRYPLLNSIIQNKFENIRDAIESAGFDYDASYKRKKWSKDKIIAEIRKLHENGEDLSTVGIKRINASLLAVASDKSHFGSWEIAIQAAGLDYSKIDRYKLAGRKSWTKEQIILEIQYLHSIDEDLSANNMVRMHSELIAAAGQKRFYGNWENALKAAGLEYYLIRKDRYMESFKGGLFEKLLRKAFKIMGWKFEHHKKFRFDDGVCVPDFVDSYTGDWIDAKINIWGMKVDTSLEKYLAHFERVAVIYLSGQPREPLQESMIFVPVTALYPELERLGADDLVKDFELLKRGELKPEWQTQLNHFIAHRSRQTA